jgi:hypothetical protein
VLRRPSPALTAAQVLLELLRGFNLLVGVVLLLAFAATFPFEPQFFQFFSKRPARIDPSWLVPILRLWMLLALPLIAIVHVFFSRLLAVIATVRTGDPFVPENAVRLQTIAWCALGGQLYELLFGVLVAAVNAAGSNVPWKFSATGWLAVVLLFVLARVFEEGTQMREDLGKMI